MSKASNSVVNSETALFNEVMKLCDAGGSVIQIRTREVVRTSLTLRKGILADGNLFCHNEWDVVNGWRNFTLEDYTNGFKNGDNPDFTAAITRPLEELRTSSSHVNANAEKIHYFVYIDAHPYINGNPFMATLIQQYAALLPSKNVCLVFITPDVPLGDLPLGTVLVADMPTPSAEELERSLENILANIDPGDWEQEHTVEDEDISRIAALGMGMTKYEFETHASLAIVQASIDDEPCVSAEVLTRGIAQGKTEVVKQSEMLELFHPEDMADVGGMQRLKDWVNNRASSFTDDAKSYGLEAPKGIALIGVPGAGKSLVAKAVAGSWGVPLIRLDFGSVFSKYVGESESRMRAALSMVSRMGRLVLFADEIDKGLAGSGGGGQDNGISSRVLGSFLTWMQENQSDVFVIMTANRIEGLPPELFRRGRLDGVFSVGLPNGDERVEVLEVHLRKRGRDITSFDADELDAFRTVSDRYLPAEIESAVKDALLLSYNDEDSDDIQMSHILEALRGMVPMSKSHETQINAILNWAETNATPVSYPEGHGKSSSVVTRLDTRRTPRSRLKTPTRPVK